MEHQGISVVKLLKQVNDRLMQNFKNEFKEMEITGPQGMLMGTLAHNGEMKISELSQYMGLSNSTVSGIVDRLEKRNLVQRTRSDADRRVVLVNVTSEFQIESQHHFEKVEESVNTLLQGASQEEMTTIYEGLETLKRLIEKSS